MVKVKETSCKTALSPCGLPEFSYSVNPYTGCAHGCVYCYARFMCKYRSPKGEWGTFVDVKTNSPEVLRKDLARNPPGRIFFSSVTDCYQPLERKYLLSQKILSAIKDYGFPVCIQTKSSLVQRDLKLISGMKDCEVGMTICFEDESGRRNLEPGASPIEERLDTLRKFSDSGVKTFVFFGPVMPGISDSNMPELFRKFCETGAKEVVADRLNIKAGNLDPIMRAVVAHYPHLASLYRKLFEKGGDREYYRRLKPQIEEAAGEAGLPVELCF